MTKLSTPAQTKTYDKARCLVSINRASRDLHSGSRTAATQQCGNSGNVNSDNENNNNQNYRRINHTHLLIPRIS